LAMITSMCGYSSYCYIVPGCTGFDDSPPKTLRTSRTQTSTSSRSIDLLVHREAEPHPYLPFNTYRVCSPATIGVSGRAYGDCCYWRRHVQERVGQSRGVCDCFDWQDVGVLAIDSFFRCLTTRIRVYAMQHANACKFSPRLSSTVHNYYHTYARSG